MKKSGKVVFCNKIHKFFFKYLIIIPPLDPIGTLQTVYFAMFRVCVRRRDEMPAFNPFNTPTKQKKKHYIQ